MYVCVCVCVCVRVCDTFNLNMGLQEKSCYISLKPLVDGSMTPFRSYNCCDCSCGLHK